MRLFGYMKNMDDFKVIKEECSDYIKEFKNVRNDAKLWRGTRKNILKYEKIIPRKNRDPRDTPYSIHEYVDRYLKKKFGWAGRSEGVFVDNNVNASAYGTTYLFFPKNGFKFIWSTEIYDLTIFLEEIRLVDNSGAGREIIEDDWKSILDEYLPSYTDHNLKKGMSMGSEVMIKCDWYYLVEKSFINNFW